MGEEVKEEEALGLRCLACGSTNVGVIDSRPRLKSRRRRYGCQSCGERFFTIEVQETLYNKMVKVVRKSMREQEEREQSGRNTR